ncbi:MAG: hypothetical protein H0S84_10975 [Bacteroidales bacterium]|nr:hypothetical protein [Bacteroidales bacterium]
MPVILSDETTSAKVKVQEITEIVKKYLIQNEVIEKLFYQHLVDGTRSNGQTEILLFYR